MEGSFYYLACVFIYKLAAMGFFCLPAFSQSKTDTAALGMAGDNLDLYAVLDLFLKSKTIEDFEKSLNDTKLKINNLDLNLDKKVDFIKVVTKKEGESYTFILQDAVSETETQDVAVILVNRDKDKKVNVQIVGDEDLYGRDYVIEPKTSGLNNYCSCTIGTYRAVCIFTCLCTLLPALSLRILSALFRNGDCCSGRHLSSQQLVSWGILWWPLWRRKYGDYK